jgi:crossover junction endodeoxyribonuclease RuvC
LIRILGIDPGLRVTGFGVVDADGPRLRYVASGVVRIGNGPLPPRLKTVHDGLAEVIREYRPQIAAVEIIFVNVNPRTTLLLGQARGAAITAAVIHELAVHEYTALQVKQAVTGYGRAAKPQIQAMVQRLLALPGLPSTDAADALACAICHAHASTMTEAATRQLAVPGLVPASEGEPGPVRRSSGRGLRLRAGRLR